MIHVKEQIMIFFKFTTTVSEKTTSPTLAITSNRQGNPTLNVIVFIDNMMKFIRIFHDHPTMNKFQLRAINTLIFDE